MQKFVRASAFAMMGMLMLFGALFLPLRPAYSQTLPPEYVIVDVKAATSPRPDVLMVDFIVQNRGGTSSTPVIIALRLSDSNAVLVQDTIPALGEERETARTLTFSEARVAAYTDSDPVFIVIQTQDNSPLDLNNAASIPLGELRAVSPARLAQGVDTSGAGESASQPFLERFGITFPFGVTDERLQIAITVTALGIFLVVVWLLTLVLRALFSRTPTMTTWQPPYAAQPLNNPNSTVGRRQLWQQHAQSDALSMPCNPGEYMARKLLLGMNGVKMQGWSVAALRISQYDQYGRITRTQTLSKKRTLRQLNNALRKSPKLTRDRAERRARPIARAIVRGFYRATKRTPGLPIALDIRFRGSHGSVRILFELYQCMGTHWANLDHWEPEMQILSGSIQENFTYALYGQKISEKPRQFRRRLTDDITRMLAAMIEGALPKLESSPTVPTPAPLTQMISSAELRSQAPPTSALDTAQMRAVQEGTRAGILIPDTPPPDSATRAGQPPIE